MTDERRRPPYPPENLVVEITPGVVSEEDYDPAKALRAQDHWVPPPKPAPREE